METEIISSAIFQVIKIIPFIKGTSHAPNLDTFPAELKSRLEAVSEAINKPENMENHEFRCRLKLLFEENEELLEIMNNAIRRFNDKAKLTKWEQERYSFFSAVTPAMHSFSEEIEPRVKALNYVIPGHRKPYSP